MCQGCNSHYNKDVEIPESIKKTHPYLLKLYPDDWYIFKNGFSVSDESLPSAKEFLKALGLTRKDYVFVGGTSNTPSREDMVCVAINKSISRASSQFVIARAIMWLTWARKNLDYIMARYSNCSGFYIALEKFPMCNNEYARHERELSLTKIMKRAKQLQVMSEAEIQKAGIKSIDVDALHFPVSHNALYYC